MDKIDRVVIRDHLTNALGCLGNYLDVRWDPKNGQFYLDCLDQYLKDNGLKLEYNIQEVFDQLKKTAKNPEAVEEKFYKEFTIQ